MSSGGIVRGTTPTLSFTLPMSLDDISVLYITFTQGGTVVLEKKISDVEYENGRIYTKLTQEDTLVLDDRLPVEIQIRFKDKDGMAYGSDVKMAAVWKVLKNGKI